MIKLEIPVYYQKADKKRKSGIRTFLISDNWFRNAHYIEQNEVKIYLTDIIALQLRKFKHITFPKEYTVTYHYYYKNKYTDLPNVISRTSKALNDTLQKVGIVKEDNVQYLVGEISKVVEEDKKNPRVEVFIHAKTNKIK